MEHSLVIWNLFNFIIIALETWMLFFFSASFLHKGSRKRYWISLISAAAVTMFITAAVNTASFDYLGGGAVCLLTDIIFLYIAFEKSLTQTAPLAFSFYALNLCAEIGVITAFDIISQYQMLEPVSHDIYQVLAAVCSKSIVLAAAILTVKYRAYTRVYSLMNRRQYTSIFLITSTVTALLFLLVPSTSITPVRAMMTLLLSASSFMLLLTVCLMFYFYRFKSFDAVRDRQRQVSRLIHSLEKQTDDLENERVKAEKQLHDLRHHHALLDAMIKKGLAKQAAAYISQMGERLPALPYHTGNIEIDMILEQYLDRLNSCGIILNIKGSLPMRLPCPVIDLCSLFSNLLENAVNGCRAYMQGKKRIDISVWSMSGALYLRIANTAGVAPARQFKGTGTEIIADIVEKHNGVRHVEIGEKEVVVTVYLKHM